MAMCVYSTGGQPVGFVYEAFIYDLSGMAVGRIVGSRAHRLDGSYVGEWFKDMIVERPSGLPRFVRPVPAPPARPVPERLSCRRAVINYGFADNFELLHPRHDYLAQAAE